MAKEGLINDMDENDRFNADKLISAQWQGIGSGSFNQVFVTKKPVTLKINDQEYHGLWVRKIPLVKNLQSDRKRGVRVWNELHPDKPAMEHPLNRTEWIAPYFGVVKANDFQTANAVLDVFKRTGRVVVDACGISNALIYRNETRIIDVDVALQPNSPASRDFAYREIQYNPVRCGYDDFWDGHIETMPITVNVTKTLCYIESQFLAGKALRSLLTMPVIEQLHQFRLSRHTIHRHTLIDLHQSCSLNEVHFSQSRDGFFSQASQDSSKEFIQTLPPNRI